MTLRINTDQNPVSIPTASPTAEGLMSAADKTKLDSLTPGGAVFVSAPLTGDGSALNPIDASAFLAKTGGTMTGLENISLVDLRTTPTPGLRLVNPTAATLGLPNQDSPQLQWSARMILGGVDTALDMTAGIETDSAGNDVSLRFRFPFQPGGILFESSANNGFLVHSKLGVGQGGSADIDSIGALVMQIGTVNAPIVDIGKPAAGNLHLAATDADLDCPGGTVRLGITAGVNVALGNATGQVGFFGQTGATRPGPAAGWTVAQLITALQSLNLIS